MALDKYEEVKKIKLLSGDMYCKKYDTACVEVPNEVLCWMYGIGFSNYECELDCKKCVHLERWE